MVAAVTGVGRHRGIGYAIARRLAEQGATLLLHAFPEDEVKEIAHELDARWTVADFADPAAPARVVEEAAGLGRLDVLVANHARSGDGSLEEMSVDELDACWQVNARGSLLLVQAFAARCQGEGRVVLITSGQYRNPMATEIPYIASKGVLHQVVPSLAAHLAPRGITVNLVDPGATDTGWASAETYEAVLAAEPRGRWGEPDDAARLVAWLCSEEAGWVTGQVIGSTGGGP